MSFVVIPVVILGATQIAHLLVERFGVALATASKVERSNVLVLSLVLGQKTVPIDVNDLIH